MGEMSSFEMRKKHVHSLRHLIVERTANLPTDLVVEDATRLLLVPVALVRLPRRMLCTRNP